MGTLFADSFKGRLIEEGETLKRRLIEEGENLKYSIPGLELIANETQCKGLYLSCYEFNSTNQRYTIVHPGEKVSAHMKYKIDADQLESLHMHHFLYGLETYGPIDCLTHTFGVMDSEGSLDISFNAPEEPGIYQLCVCYGGNGINFTRATEAWNKDYDDSSKKIIGILIVK